ncbi:T9SS type B sorting domain-containing protein [Changchengzhania lutea]|uniref:T9SS type B sorting domain-containing protein n=1 Tax=Changchengzhania lutea TaxID=2049305 RepID=UPI00115DD83A|nr:choice-of-anchor L domain-containing protein [Changchengzhania lutea]
MTFRAYIILIVLLLSKCIYSQVINVDGSIGVQPLIENNLVDGCVEITNITSSINGSVDGLSSFAYFEKGNSNFPFESGIMLSSGNAPSGGNNPNVNALDEGTTNWGTDPDLEAVLGITGTVNATSIEFDFVSISNQVQFNYLFASEEYFDLNPCSISDSFVFLIKETGSAAPYQNLAVVPGTNIPVNTRTIHNDLSPACAAENEAYFDGYNIGDTNYNGRTTVLSAGTTIVPYVQYHIKLVIADENGTIKDSAVFIEGNSFKNIDLGEDILTCDPSVPLDADIQNPLASYAWYLDGVLIPGENNATLDAEENGTYRVEVTVPLNNSDCTEIDEINVVVSFEEPMPTISDYLLCDDPSADQTEVFNLATKDGEISPIIPFTNGSFTYHPSETDARNNTNSITTPYPNVTNPQSIFVRVDDLDSDCFTYTSFDLIVNQVPIVTAPSPLEICDGDDLQDGYTLIDLTQKDVEVTSGSANLVVTYHYTQADADTGLNPIVSPYVNTNTPSDTVYIRVLDTQTGCFNTTSLVVDITNSPDVNRDVQFIDACDEDQDGFAAFDLTQVIADILQGLTGVTRTFHETFTDAQTGDNPIANETNYQNINLNQQTVYLRILDDVTGCASVVPFEIHTNLLLTGTDTGDFALCDTNDDENDTLKFNLNTVELFIANELPNIEVTFYEEEEDRDNEVNPVDKTQLYEATSPTTLYISITNGACTEVSEIRLIVNPILLFNPVDPVPYCDNDEDGIVNIDFTLLDDRITNGNTNFEVRYYPTQIDAENDTNQYPPSYENSDPLEPVFAKIVNLDTGCSTINSFQIEIIPAPAAISPTPIFICDDDQDGVSTINLEDKLFEIVSTTSNVNIDFYTSFINAETETDPIPNPTTYIANTQDIFVRVENDDTLKCFNIVTLNIFVNTLPQFDTISNFQICQNTGSNVADFLLVEKDTEILNDQTGKEVYYFENESDALNGNLSNAIDKNENYRNTSSPQTIYVRAENTTDSGCFNTTSFILQVSPDPVYNNPTPFFVCDDSSNDGVSVFDFNEKIAEIEAGSTDLLNISFHETLSKAENNLDALDTTYTNITNPQTVYVRIESDDSLCYVVEELDINIIAAPDITEASPLVLCDDGYDGSVSFNLENADFQILDRIQTNLSVHYYTNFEDINQEDGLDNTNQIPDPTNYISNSATVWIKVLQNQSSCFSVIPLELQVNLPPEFNAISTIPICDNDTNTFDLNEINPLIVDDLSVVNISYHDTQTDADDNINPLANTYNYTTNNHIIFIRIAYAETGCPITTSFNLVINENPIANQPPDLTDCDDNFDGALEFDLSVNSNAVIGSQTENLSVTYYSSFNNAFDAENPLSNSHAAFNGENVFVRIENNDTGCFDITDFTIFVDPLPVIPINDIVPLCLNDLPLIINADTGILGETYSWSTTVNPRVDNSTLSEIQIEPTELGEYSITVTSPEGCQFTKNFTVIDSEEATINFTTTVDFADPNSITVDVSGIGDYVFILDDGEPQTSNVFENVTFGLHNITIRDLNGCKDIIEEVVVIDVPKFVTPNNDGAYDRWHIVGIEQLPGTVVYIYDRYGKLLKTLPSTSMGWDGTFNGYNMPADDYWFLAKVKKDGTDFDVRGHFSLKR